MQQNVPVHFKKWTKYFPVTLQPLLDTAAETHASQYMQEKRFKTKLVLYIKQCMNK